MTSAIPAAEAGVSRTTARRALRGLAERGLLAWHGESAVTAFTGLAAGVLLVTRRRMQQ